MHWNKYNLIVRNGKDQYLLYKSTDDRLMVCFKDVKDILEENMNYVDEIAKIHPDLYKYLEDNGFILPDDIDETEQFIESIRKSDQSEESLVLTINPTLNCNLRCWYCYEKHKENTFISETVKNSINRLVGNKIEKGLKNLHVGFFGGEPLLEFDSFIFPFLSEVKETCERNHVELSLSFTTNAVLLNSERVAKLKSLNVPVDLQIPFDGGKIMHDKTKKTEDGVGTYDIILSNLKSILSSGFNALIRCNYTNKNIDSFAQLIEDMQTIGKNYEEQLSFSFQKVWQEKESEELNDKLRMLYDKIENNTNKINISSVSYRCYADKENNIVINYNGDIYKCTGRDFLPELREGVLHEDGSIEYNERFYDRMDTKYEWNCCKDCLILPICNICSQVKLESIQENVCLRGNPTDEKKRSIIIDRIKSLNARKIKSI